MRLKPHMPPTRGARLLAAALIPLLFTACAENKTSADMSNGYVGDLLSVDPPGPVEVGFSDTVTFKVTLTDERGEPVSGAPLDITFIEQPHNARVTPDRLVTDAQGKGSVEFTAPTPTENEPVTFNIRFRSAEAEAFVDVRVDPGLVTASFEVNYPGNRELTELTADLYRIDGKTGDRIHIASDAQDAVFPARFEFQGVLREERYEAEVGGLNEEKIVRATGILEDLTPNEKGLTLSLEDTPLNITGNFAASWEITTNGALDWAVDRLVDTPPFIQNTASAVLDGIEDVLSVEDAFAKETFIVEREEKNLDAYLDDHLRSLDIDLQASFETVRQATKQSAEDLRAEGTLEIGKTEDDYFIGYHAINRLTFGLRNDSIGPEMYVDMLDRASCEVTYGPEDTLVIGEHDLPIGLGIPIERAFTYSCGKILGYEDIADAIKSIVDCAEIATFLEPSLNDVTVRSSIELGCLTAIETAEEDISAAVTDISETNLLSFSKGVCRLVIPTVDNLVTELTGEDFNLHWHTVGGDAAPMNASFSAAIP